MISPARLLHRSAHSRTVPSVRRVMLFAKNEEGTITIFACFMIFMMMLIAGIGVDMMHHEMERTRLQALSDRAVLAAADLDQQLNPTDVVRDYFDKANVPANISNINVVSGQSTRQVTVEASMNANPMFMSYFGVDEILVPALATASEVVPNVEISLVLDISGSMRFSNRMDQLRPAASEFIETVLADEVQAKTSVNLIPYAGQTNVGPTMFDLLGGQRYQTTALDEALGGMPESDRTGYLPTGAIGGQGADPDIRYVHPNVSSCLELQPEDIVAGGVDSQGFYQQTPHFMNWAIDPSVMEWGWCPQDDTQIQYLSNNRQHLTDFINTMPMHDGTGTHYAMKYAVAMLDPSSNPHVNALIGAGEVAGLFSQRPASYEDASTRKYVILMTDGQITEQARPEDPVHPDNPSRELKSGHTGDKEQITSAGTNVASFFAQCDYAKARRPHPIIVYTIAFEAPGAAQDQMRECASSPSHYFTADDQNIDEVFKAIAHQITRLKLTH